MHLVIRITSILAVSQALAVPLPAALSADRSEYKQADQNLYPRTDVLKVDPKAVIMGMDSFTRGKDANAGSFFTAAHKHPAKIIYLLQSAQWIEPITPPSMPGNLNIPLDVMQVREPQGDIQVALPAAPASFNGVTEGMVIPNGSVLKTGGNGSVAVLFGGVDSVRLTPNSQAAVQLSVKPGLRDAEVDLHSGIAFSKVGLRLGEKEDYEVHTPFGMASAHGTDFATAALPQRTDVWVAQGTVELTAPDGKKVGSIVTEGKNVLKVMRNPPARDAQTGLDESAESLTQAVSFISTANPKLKALDDRTKTGAKLTPTEIDYVTRIRKIPYLIKLTYVEPPAPPAPPVVMVPPPAPQAKPVIKPATGITSNSSTTDDPNSLIPGVTPAAKKSANSTSHSDNGSIRTVAPRKINLDLRDQDNSQPAHGPNDTIP